MGQGTFRNLFSFIVLGEQGSTGSYCIQDESTPDSHEEENRKLLKRAIHATHQKYTDSCGKAVLLMNTIICYSTRCSKNKFQLFQLMSSCYGAHPWLIEHIGKNYNCATFLE